ncbi:MAG: glutamine amidotransferase [Acidobacteria bacterium]|nr:glutamine amidotransferase [Acidobacteriota bacterium]
MDRLFESLFKYRFFLFREGELTFDSPVSAWWLLPALALAAAAAFWVYRRRSSGNRTRRRRQLLIVLRALSLILLLALLFRPSLQVSTHLPRKSRIALLIDGSQSMRLPHDSGRSRWEAALGWLDPGAGSVLADLEERFQLQVLRFDRDIREIRPGSNLPPEGTGTSLEAALAAVRKHRGEGQPLAGVVLLSDGADNLSRQLPQVLETFRRERIPVHTVAVGQDSLGKDIQVSQVTFAPRILPGSSTRGVVSLTSVGYPGRRVSVEIRESGTLVASQPVTLSGSDTSQIVELSLKPEGSGLKHYTVSVAPQPGEAIERNNRRDLLLHVEDSRPRILYLEGTPRWEFKFIRRALQEDPNLQLVTLLRTSDNKFYHQGLEGEDPLAAGFPQTPDQLYSYKGLILGSIEAGFFTPSQQEMIVDFVGERGGGFMMLGGRSSFDAGGYADTDIAEMLPVHLGDRDPDSSYVTDWLSFDLTAYGRQHPALQLVSDPAANLRRWRNLPPISAYNRISRAKPGAAVLARGGGGDRRAILLAAHRFGSGRAIAFMAAASWHWQMELAHTDQTHATFWRQLLRWLVASSSDPLQVTFDREIYEDEDAVGIEVALKDAFFNPAGDRDVEATIASPGATIGRLPLSRNGSDYAGRFQPGERGIHQVRVKASREGLESESAEAFFLVTRTHREFFDAGANPSLLRRIARETGGRHYTLEDAARLPEEITYADSPNTVLQVLPLWDMPFLFMLLGALLCSEWFLRKRWGWV